MDTLAGFLTATELDTLRGFYDARALLDLKVSATAAAHPPHLPWASAIRDVFFAGSSLAAGQRELCIITLLAYRAPQLSLATHVYAGLMEGLSVAEICEAIGLSGCYAGMPAYTEALGTVQKTLAVMKRMAGDAEPRAEKLLMELVSAFTGQTLPRAEP
jgi:alkylhydroperoxidase/carboxymuconolactone decarboxylase family protein YurZ